MAFPPLSVGMVHEIVAVLGAITNVRSVGALAAAPGAADTTAETAPLPTWLTAVTRK